MILRTKLALGSVAAGTTAATGGLIATKSTGSNNTLNETDTINNLENEIFKNVGTIDANVMPSWVSLTQDDNFSSYNNKYIAPYSQYFVGVGSTLEDNAKWWTWSFENRYSDLKTRDSNFPEISSAKELMDICRNAYASNANAEELNFLNWESINSQEEMLWKLCSPAEGKIDTIAEYQSLQQEDEKEEYKTAGTYGFEGKNYLVSIKSASVSNYWFWEIKEKEFFANTDRSEVESTSFGELYTTTTSEDEEEEGTEASDKPKLKDKCKEAYTYTGSERNKEFPEKIVYKYCSIKGFKG